MGKSKLVFRAAIVALLFSCSAAFAFRDTGDVKTAKVTRQKYLTDVESRALLKRSPTWEKFRQDFGENIRVTWNLNSDTPHRIVTSGLQLVQNLDNSNIKSVSDAFVNRYSDLLGVKPSDLRLQTAGFHGRMWYVIYDRYYSDLPVYNARVHLTFHSNGNLVSFGSDAYPGIKLDTNPKIGELQAIDIVRREVRSTSSEDKALSTRLLVLPLEIGDDYSAHLAWEIEYYTPDPLARWFMYVDAHSGEILMYWDAIMYAFTGNVNGGVQLNGAYDVFVNLPFKDLTVNAIGYGWDVTDVGGNYSIPGSGSAAITAQLLGPYVNVNRYEGSDADFSGSSSGALNIDWTSISQPQERDAYYHAIIAHDYINYVDPSFTRMDFQLPCFINVPGLCNAYWDGSSINFFEAGGNCPNTAQMSTVVYHEYGHGITDYFYDPVNLPNRYETGGLKEAWSDFMANCITDQPLGARGWFGPGTYLRSSDNTAQYPGTECGGEPHCMGDILVGALWDMRVNLITTHGNDIKPYVDSLWHYARYAKPTSYHDYLWELLLYDDDDGNPLNGTPNYYDICDGFDQHNMDCPEIVGTLNGTVSDIDGPVGGVTVFADDGLGRTGSDLTLGDGTYSMDIPASTYDVLYTHPLYAPLNISEVVVVENVITTQNAFMTLLPQPDIDVSPTSLSGRAPEGGSDTDSFSISNLGDSTLTFEVSTSINSINLLSAKGSADMSIPIDKPEFTGSPNIPDRNVILQGGDNIGSATSIPSLPYHDTGTTSGYTDDYDEACPSSGSISPDVVYSYTPPADAIVDITLCNGSDYDTKLYLYENGYTPGNPYACNDDECPGYVSELIGVFLTGGNTYYIVIDGFGGDHGNYVLDMTCTVISWLTVNISSGSIPPGQPSISVTATMDATFQTAGSYSQDIIISSNDPDEPSINIPVTFTVGGYSYIVGDVNGSDHYNGLDITYGVAYFKGGPEPLCPDFPIGDCNSWNYCGDVNANCDYNGLDITYGVAYFKSGSPEPMPCPDCPPSGVSAGEIKKMETRDIIRGKTKSR